MDVETLLDAIRAGKHVSVLLSEETSFDTAHAAFMKLGEKNTLSLKTARLITVEGPMISVWLDGNEHPLDRGLLKSQ